MTPRIALPTLLSQSLVAFTIEFDNEAEHRLGHRTSTGNRRGSAGPWLVSQAMWANFMRFVGEDAVPLGDLEGAARLTNLKGLQRWGYVVVEPSPPSVAGRGPAGSVRVTAAGRRACRIWEPLAAEIEERWRGRFGAAALDTLRGGLLAVVAGLPAGLPRYLPVTHPAANGKVQPEHFGPPGGGMAAEATDPAGRAGRLASLDVSALLAQALLGFTVEYEREAAVALPVAANTLRVLTRTGVRVRDLPALTGISKEGNAMALGMLERRDCVSVGADPTARSKLGRLTERGARSQAKHYRLVASTEQQWVHRFGPREVRRLRDTLEALVRPVQPGSPPPLWRGLEPHPDGWRASVPPPAVLPHHPMVLHRGGFPDGS